MRLSKLLETLFDKFVFNVQLDFSLSHCNHKKTVSANS